MGSLEFCFSPGTMHGSKVRRVRADMGWRGGCSLTVEEAPTKASSGFMDPKVRGKVRGGALSGKALGVESEWGNASGSLSAPHKEASSQVPQEDLAQA